MKTYELPDLPEPWYWAFDLDGEPCAKLKIEEGRQCVVYHGEFGPYRGNLAISHGWDVVIPYRVFAAVDEALKKNVYPAQE